jgi:hypothetical protein
MDRTPAHRPQPADDPPAQDAPPHTDADAPSADPLGAYLGALLATVSHDLRSPLLTLSLSGELLRESSDPQREEVALDALREGVRDLERMLDAVTTLSRANKRELAAGQAPLAPVLRRFHFEGALPAGGATVAADPRLASDFLETLSVTDGPVRLRELPRTFAIDAPIPDGDDVPPGSPLEALLDSLKTYAGTLVERLGAIELQAQRSGGSLQIERGRAVLYLPRAGAPTTDG